ARPDRWWGPSGSHLRDDRRAGMDAIAEAHARDDARRQEEVDARPEHDHPEACPPLDAIPGGDPADDPPRERAGDLDEDVPLSTGVENHRIPLVVEGRLVGESGAKLPGCEI